MNLKIGILCGGDSAEKVISFKSAAVVKKHLESEDIFAKLVVISKERWFVKDENEEIDIDKNDFSYRGQKFDILFNAIHGTPGENGVFQAYLDLVGMKYTGSNSFASALTFDKWTCNRFLLQLGFDCATALKVRKGDEINVDKIIKKTKLPCFVKPNCAGSSFGVSKVEAEKDLQAAINKAFEHDNEALVEQFLDGKELTCGAFSYKGRITALPVTEIVSKNSFFDFEAKYNGASDEITPARIDDTLRDKIQGITRHAFEQLRLKGFARLDFIAVNNHPYVVEVNTVPGLSEESLVPKQLKEAGIKLSSFFKMMVEEAV